MAQRAQFSAFGRRGSYLCFLVVLSILLAACANVPASNSNETTEAETSTETSAPAATVRIGWAGSPDTLNPGTAVLTEAYTIFELVYDSMFQLQLDGSYTPELAESYTVSDDGTVWTFTIRDGIQWHDGEPLTAADIAFSYNLYKNQESFPFLPVYTTYFDTIEAPDANTVVITLSEAIPNMESQLVFLYVVPEHIWGTLEGEAAVAFENEAMIGSGPFRLTEYSQNQFLRLTAVTDHYLQAPKINEAIFQTFDNQDALVQALRTGQVDMITEMPNTAVPSLRDAENIVLVSGPPASPSVSDIFFNVVTPENCPPEDGVCSGHPALQDRAVRIALAHATDLQQIVDVTLLGLGTPGFTLIPDSLGIWYNDSLEPYVYDIEVANQMLDDAGYLDTDGDGMREMPDGAQPLSLRVNWPSDSTWASRGAELLSGMWQQVGVATELQALDADTLTAVCCPAFDYDVILWGWGSDPDPGFLLGVTTTDEIPTGNSETGYSNADYDALFTQQAVELDMDRRQEMVWEMQQIVYDDAIYLTFYGQSVQAYRTDRFTGWQTDAGKIALEDPSSLLVIEPVQ